MDPKAVRVQIGRGIHCHESILPLEPSPVFRLTTISTLAESRSTIGIRRADAQASVFASQSATEIALRRRSCSAIGAAPVGAVSRSGMRQSSSSQRRARRRLNCWARSKTATIRLFREMSADARARSASSRRSISNVTRNRRNVHGEKMSAFSTPSSFRFGGVGK